MSIIASAPVPSASRLIDAPTVDLTAIPRPRPTVRDLAAKLALGREVDRLVIGTKLTDAEVAARLGVSENEAFDAYELYEAERRAGRAGASAECPSYCSQDHRGQLREAEGFTLGLVHERVAAEVTALDPTTIVDPATAAVLVECTTEGGEVVTPTRVVLTVAEGPEGTHAGGEGVQGWTGTPEQAEELARALLFAANIARLAQ